MIFSICAYISLNYTKKIMIMRTLSALLLFFSLSSCEIILNRSAMRQLEGTWKLDSKYKIKSNGSYDYSFYKNDSIKRELKFIWKRDFEQIITTDSSLVIEEGSYDVYGKGDSLDIFFDNNDITCEFVVEDIDETFLHLKTRSSNPEDIQHLHLSK
jgi:hypothetical protein